MRCFMKSRITEFWELEEFFMQNIRGKYFPIGKNFFSDSEF